MTYRYNTGVIIPFVQKHFKLLILAVTALFVSSVLAMTLSARAVNAPNWEITPGSEINFSCGGSYLHTLDTVVKGNGGDFTGTGHYNADPAYTWSIDGTIEADTFDFTILYTGLSAGSVYNATNGVISPDGSATATVDSNCDSLTLAAGSFTELSLPETEVDVYGDTGAENEKGAWMFNRDPSTATAFSFVNGVGTLGDGSVYAGPITNTGYNGLPNPPVLPNWDKFAAEYFAREPISNFDSLSYDFKIAGTGDAADANQYYVNFYTTVVDGPKFYDCRFDYVPSIGSNTNFETMTVNFDDVATNTRVGSAPTGACPPSKKMSDMPAGSYIRAIAINMGDTSATDQDLEGYFDRVVYSTVNGTTTFDLEPYTAVTSKNDCKNGGWEKGLSYDNQDAFRNQGDCVSYFATKTANPPTNGATNERANRNR